MTIPPTMPTLEHYAAKAELWDVMGARHQPRYWTLGTVRMFGDSHQAKYEERRLGVIAIPDRRR
jgi:hypothetical protein